jgi:hypothetical protein
LIDVARMRVCVVFAKPFEELSQPLSERVWELALDLLKFLNRQWMRRSESF